MQRLRSCCLAVLLSFVLPVPHALAGSASTTMAVSGTMLSVCIVVALPLVFGNYSSTQISTTTTVTVTCTPGASYNVQLDAGGSTGATVTTRKMTYLTNTLDYALYRDSSYSQNWGTTNGMDTIAGTGTALPQIITVYGRIPGGQFATPGAYLDTVNVTVAY